MTLKDAWVPGYICTNRDKDQGPRGKRDNNQVISHRESNKDFVNTVFLNLNLEYMVV